MSYFDEFSAAAINSLSAVTATATATGNAEVARASIGVQYVIINYFGQPPADIEQKSQESLPDLERTANSLAAFAPETEAFKCKRDLDNCLQHAMGAGGKSLCWISHAACLAKAIRATGK